MLVALNAFSIHKHTHCTQLDLVNGDGGNNYDVVVNLTGPILLGLGIAIALLFYIWLEAVERVLASNGLERLKVSHVYIYL